MVFGSFHLQNRAAAGNALFLILIAVALFAALSYAVTQSGRGGSGGAGREQTTLGVAQFYQIGAEMQQAVQRMVLMNGCTDLTLNFYSTNFRWSPPGNGSNFLNAAAPADGSCDVFGANGGGVTWRRPPMGISVLSPGAITNEYGITPRWSVAGVGTDPPANSSTAATADLLLMGLVTQQACVEINNREGVDISGGIPSGCAGFPSFEMAGNNDFTGDYSDPDTGCGIGNTAGSAAVAGKQAGCLNDGGRYFFYYVVLAR